MVYTTGPTVLLNQPYREIHFVESINSMLDWDKVKCHLSPGTCVKAMVLNILTSHASPYRVEDFYEAQDVGLLFNDSLEANDFNDDGLGVALDKIYQAGSWKVYSTLAFKTLQVLDLPLQFIHTLPV